MFATLICLLQAFAIAPSAYFRPLQVLVCLGAERDYATSLQCCFVNSRLTLPLHSNVLRLGRPFPTLCLRCSLVATIEAALLAVAFYGMKG
jgi:hypothetical protein